MESTMDKPFFSVVLPCYNREAYLARAIKSVLQQTFQSWELIIVDDGSTDDSVRIARSFEERDARINLRIQGKNLERCISRNNGIDEAKGRYICFLDSDDYHLPMHLQRLYDFIQSKDFKVGMFFTNSWNEYPDGEREARTCPPFEEYDSFTYFLRFTVNPQRWAVHHEVLNQVRFDPEVTICEDMDTSLRIAAASFPIYHLKERTTIYFAAPDSFTHGASDKWSRELFNLKRIFSKALLKGKLPLKEKKRLLSMCYFFLSQGAFREGKWIKTWIHGLRSFFLFPEGYNGRTNRSLFVSLLLSLPFVREMNQLRKRPNG